MKILVATGAFKQSLTAARACAAIARGLHESGLDADIEQLPIADGGNGTLDAFLASGGERITVPALDPLSRPISADYGLIDAGKTAVIEMSLASGLELLSPSELDPLRATTYGTGQLMADALERGVERIILGLGGSATVDGGMGCLQALGLQALDASGKSIAAGGAGLADIATIDGGGLDARWADVDIIIASDVENPTLGEKGAARIFGPQKGADAAMVEQLERNLEHCFTTVYQQGGVDVRHVKGGGAAGAFAAGLMAFLNCKLVSGIDLVLEKNGFLEKLAGASLVITGEGQIDAQTLDGKGPLGVAKLAAEHGVPTVGLVGGLNIDDALLHQAGVHAAFSIVDKPMSLPAALADADDLLRRAALRLGYVLQLQLADSRERGA
ncbi:MAG: glycerate kinase [Chloroflexi bacterium]|nr:glycerate kinase [Chloroflexota bacterium]